MRPILATQTSHVVDILGSVIGRDQPILLLDRALDLVSLVDRSDFRDPRTVFFDPFCKAGEILLACAFYSCLYKLMESPDAINLDEIRKEIFESNRYVAMSPDERHHRLSLRTFLGNKNSHDKKYARMIRDGHYLSEIDGRLDMNKFEKELNIMLDYICSLPNKAKIVVVGNPPYQESDGGFGKSAKSIYNLFTQSLINSPKISEFILVIPARWFAGGKGLDDFRTNMMNSEKIKNLRYFKNSNQIFPTVDINGGVCFLHYVKDYRGLTVFSDGDSTVQLSLNEFDIVTDDPLGFAIVRKLLKQWQKEYVGSIAWPRNPFGLSTDFFIKHEEVRASNTEAVPCLSRGKNIKYVQKKFITRNMDKINYWKVSVPKAAGGSKGKRRSTVPVNQILLVQPGTVMTETYNVIDVFSNRKKAENFVQYLKTDFARYLVGLRKITQDVTSDRWNWVPYVDVNINWTDEMLFSFFELTQSEREHIRKKVREWS